MSMPSPIGRNRPDAMKPLEMRAQDIADFAEHLAEDVRGRPDRALEAIGTLAEWCEGDADLLAHARSEVLRRRGSATIGALQKNRDAILLLDLVGSVP
jgi:hypothetical protein